MTFFPSPRSARSASMSTGTAMATPKTTGSCFSPFPTGSNLSAVQSMSHQTKSSWGLQRTRLFMSTPSLLRPRRRPPSYGGGRSTSRWREGMRRALSVSAPRSFSPPQRLRRAPMKQMPRYSHCSWVYCSHVAACSYALGLAPSPQARCTSRTKRSARKTTSSRTSALRIYSWEVTHLETSRAT